MVPICFNVSVYLMEKSNISKKDKCRIQDEAVRTSDTSLLDEVVMVNPISVTSSHADNEDIKASEIYDSSQNLANSTDGNFSNNGIFPIVQFDNESGKENQSEVASPHLLQNVDSDFSSTRVFLSVPLDSGSSKENPTAKTSAVKEHIHPEAILDSESNMDEREVDKVAEHPRRFLFLSNGRNFCSIRATKTRHFCKRK